VSTASEDREEPVGGLAERERQLVGQDVVDRILWPERRPRPHRRRAKGVDRLVPEAIRERGEERGPSIEPGRACRLEQSVRVAGGRERRFIYRRFLVSRTGDYAPGRRHRQAS
jgi:hypothetical protein